IRAWVPIRWTRGRRAWPRAPARLLPSWISTPMAERQRDSVAAASGFVLRTPLLPFSTLEQWASDLECSTSWSTDSLEQALVKDRRRLRGRLAEWVARPEIREALFLASPSLEADLPRW